MGNAGSIFDCAVNPLAPVPAEGGDAAEGPPRPVVFEDATPLRESALWRLQRAFYEAHGVRAWSSSVVPHFVTTNAFVAKGYAKVALGLLRDTFGGPGGAAATAPVYIVELGAGHGKLGYLVVETLLRYRSFFPPTAVPGGVPFKYVMTGARVCAEAGRQVAQGNDAAVMPPVPCAPITHVALPHHRLTQTRSPPRWRHGPATRRCASSSRRACWTRPCLTRRRTRR